MGFLKSLKFWDPDAVLESTVDEFTKEFNRYRKWHPDVGSEANCIGWLSLLYFGRFREIRHYDEKTAFIHVGAFKALGLVEAPKAYACYWYMQKNPLWERSSLAPASKTELRRILAMVRRYWCSDHFIERMQYEKLDPSSFQFLEASIVETEEELTLASDPQHGESPEEQQGLDFIASLAKPAMVIEDGLPAKDLGPMSDFDNDLVESYSAVMQTHKGLIQRASELPSSHAEISIALRKALVDPVFKLGSDSIVIGLLLLHTYVPDNEYESADRAIKKAISLRLRQYYTELESYMMSQTPVVRKAVGVWSVHLGLGKHRKAHPETDTKTAQLAEWFRTAGKKNSGEDRVISDLKLSHLVFQGQPQRVSSPDSTPQAVITAVRGFHRSSVASSTLTQVSCPLCTSDLTLEPTGETNCPGCGASVFRE